MKNIPLRRPSKAAYFVLFCLYFFFISCEKREDSLGLDLQPEEEFLNLVTVEGLEIETRTVRADSARTNELTRALLGNIHHPTFGEYSSVIYTQIRLSALGADFGTQDSVVVDSLVLSLDYFEDEEVYGLVEPMLFSVKRISEDLDLDSTYYSNFTSVVFEGELLESTGPFSFNTEDDVVVDGDTLPAQLRLRLRTAVGEELVDNAYGDDSAFDEIDDFLDYFKGLRIEAINQGLSGGIASFDLLSNLSKVTLYYHNDVDTAQFDFTINQNAQRYLSFTHDYTGTPVEAQLNDPSLGQNELYLQATGGVNFTVNVSEILSLSDTIQAAFNKVELVVPVAEAMDNESFPFPERLFAVYENEDGDILSIPDLFEGEAHSDGFYNEDTKDYRINITRYAQQLVNGDLLAEELKVLPTSNAISPNFVTLVGSDGMMRRVKLVVTYTEFE
ncbi:MAG: DUF4270 family protein [Flavobacteriales bacterium]|nr:DUF4270 family protein [Flavobacteriales bacterium]